MHLSITVSAISTARSLPKTGKFVLIISLLVPGFLSSNTTTSKSLIFLESDSSYSFSV